MNFRVSDHAQFECERRQIPLDVLTTIVENPEQIISVEYGRRAYQSKVKFGDKTYLVRVIVDPQEDPALIITVYRTSKIDKYWSSDT